ncbi:uncharacterized protein LOC127499855 [Ctenopharyngodon idella]|uniref:uncharacterized protein LOC127499855 n=1 Tax=Ctenopharyngodon idella TaxID=7959 RepID=UPI0022317179|nr:uncharacterized protein LOC127499855 [Ctenopharyngodon idella]
MSNSVVEKMDTPPLKISSQIRPKTTRGLKSFFTAVLFFLSCYKIYSFFFLDATDEMRTVSLTEGNSVTLHTDANKVQKYMLIQWRFGSTRIAEVSKLTQTNSTYDGPAERFRDRLKLDQNGSLTITNTRTTDSGLYTVTVISKETSYVSFNLTVNESPQSTSSLERSSSSNFLSTSCVVNNLTINQTEHANITELNQPSSDHIHCCGFVETVIRLVLSALVGMATVAFLVYDMRSTRSELIRPEKTRHHCQTHRLKSDRQYEMSRSFSSRYVC